MDIFDKINNLLSGFLKRNTKNRIYLLGMIHVGRQSQANQSLHKPRLSFLGNSIKLSKGFNPLEVKMKGDVSSLEEESYSVFFENYTSSKVDHRYKRFVSNRKSRPIAITEMLGLGKIKSAIEALISELAYSLKNEWEVYGKAGPPPPQSWKFSSEKHLFLVTVFSKASSKINKYKALMAYT